MQKSLTIIILIISLLLIQSSCRTIRSNRVPDFHIKKSYYQSWTISPQIKGTDVIVSVSNVRAGIHFKSIIFRGIEVPVQQRIFRNKVVLKATFNRGLTKLKSNSKINRQANQLRYMLGNKEKFIPLNNIKRKKNKYYKIR